MKKYTRWWALMWVLVCCFFTLMTVSWPPHSSIQIEKLEKEHFGQILWGHEGMLLSRIAKVGFPLHCFCWETESTRAAHSPENPFVPRYRFKLDVLALLFNLIYWFGPPWFIVYGDKRGAKTSTGK